MIFIVKVSDSERLSDFHKIFMVIKIFDSMKRISIIVSVLAVLVSCQKAAPVVDDNTIIFEMSIPETKVAGGSFENGDKVSVWAVECKGEDAPELQIGGNFLNNEQLTYSGRKWVASRPVYWSENPCDFYAVYPYIKPTSVESFLYDIATDQNSEGDATTLGGFEASDLMIAKAERVSRGAGKVVLKFEHMMSKCIVNIIKGESFEGELPNDISVHIYNTVTTADVNIANCSVEKYALGSRKTITMKKVANTTFEAIVIPQNIERKTPLIEVSMGGIAYLLEYSLSFRPGYQHTINLTVNTSPDQEKFEIGFDISAQ